MKCIFTIGVSGSGKSYWAEDFCEHNGNWEIIERDRFRISYLQRNCTYMEGMLWKLWKWEKESLISAAVHEYRDTLVGLKKNIIFSDTNLNAKYLKQSINYMESVGYEVELKYLPIDYETAVKRDKMRSNTVGIDVINRQWVQWLQLPRDKIGIPLYQRDDTKPVAIVVDIDGTVANFKRHDHSFIRNPYDWDKVDRDAPIPEIIELVKMYHNNGRKIVFLSGRDAVSRELTVKWINQHIGIPEFVLHMRTEGDMRKDRIIKDELFWGLVVPKYDVEFTVDDRKQMVRYWADIGVKLLNVGNFYEDF
jgi:predicted kinase